MKIIVAIKQVPVRDSQLRVDGSGKWIQEADLSFEINEPDAYALEEALQLKEKHGGEVIALCAGPARAGADHSRSAGQGRGSRDSHRRRESEHARHAGRREAARGGGESGESGSDPHRFAIGRSGLRADWRRGGGVAGPAAFDHHHAGRSRWIQDPREARAGGRLVPAHRHAAARGADDSERHQQTALRDADGHQESQDERDQDA